MPPTPACPPPACAAGRGGPAGCSGRPPSWSPCCSASGASPSAETATSNRGQTVALGAPAAGGATAEARMRGAGDDQIMTMTAKGLPRPPADAYYEVWLVGDAGQELPVGVLAPNGEGVWSLPADVAARYRAVDVTLEQADGDPSRSDRTVLRGTYA
ncbi:MAG TPA: anti-sigma factor [Actinomycetes bacterium]|nr:anti-sigma factor [Actinomycetes bacterium]